MTPPNKGKKLPPEPLTADEVRALVNACSNRAPTGIRNRALIVTLYRAGLRISESLKFKEKDLDMERGTIRVLNGKGDRARLIGIDNGAIAVLQRWLDRRESLGIGKRSPIFCTLQGGWMKTSYVRNLLPRLAKKAGIEKRTHAHGLRHSLAFELANEGVPLHVIQQQLGHSSLATTDRYIRHLNPTALVATMQSREWNL